MRGFPLINLLAVAAILAVMLIPLLRVDRPSARRAVEGSAMPAETVPVTLLLRGVHAPSVISVTVDGQPVALRGEGLERQGEARMPRRDQALELELKASWPTDTGDTMVEVKAAPDGMEEQAQNVWAEAGAADEIVRFTWRAKP